MRPGTTRANRTWRLPSRFFVADSLEQVRHHVEPSFLNYFRAIGIQARLGARDDSAKYDYLRAIVKRVESMTWERIEASMGLYGPAGRCIDKIQDIAASCPHGPAHLLV